MDTETVIRTTGLAKSFRSRVKAPGLAAAARGLFRPEWRDVEALKPLDLEVARGDMLALIGPNGAGKSTTVKLLTGILYPDAGRAEVLGLDPNRQRRRLAYRIGTVFGQKSQLWYHLPPGDTFRLLGSIYDIPRKDLETRTAFLSEAFDLADLMDVPTRKLSLGQRIRCEVAASLIHDPEILFLDEPSIGLDVVAKKRLRALIRRINAESGVTVVLTSHDAGDIESIGRRAVVINHGAVIWNGTVKDLKYSLLTTRVVDVKLENPGPVVPRMGGVKILKEREWSMKLEVDLRQADLPEVIAEITGRNAVADLAVSPTPLEEIIARVYQGDLAGAPRAEADA